MTRKEYFDKIVKATKEACKDYDNRVMGAWNGEKFEGPGKGQADLLKRPRQWVVFRHTAHNDSKDLNRV